MAHWLLKSEPESFSIADMKAAKVTAWDGIRNYQARNFMRDSMSKGDRCLFYHSNGDPPAAVGVVEVASERAIVDATQFDPADHHHDPKSDRDDPRWLCVEVRYRSTFKRPVTLPMMRQDPALSGMLLLRPGQRLSVLPLTETEYARILELAEG